MVANVIPFAVEGDLDSVYTGTWVGWVAAAGDILYTKTGKIVSLKIPLVTGTSNSISKSVSGMPIAILPSSEVYFFIRISNNGASAVIGGGYIRTSGIIDFYINPVNNAWTNSGIATINPCEICYSI
jgi:hypothetical protein